MEFAFVRNGREEADREKIRAFAEAYGLVPCGELTGANIGEAMAGRAGAGKNGGSGAGAGRGVAAGTGREVAAGADRGEIGLQANKAIYDRNRT